jgi:hypothetical protein
MNSKAPFSSVTLTTVMPVSRFVSVTVAPGITPPESSLTVPTMVAESNWATAGAPNNRLHSKARQMG